ncbi:MULTISPECIES: hypothetical protein [unclassified Microcoleus]|uniref:hypothetical protein n=1 Tax=unclassified Microcoleus TaxID=2642155 RepID=UPI002FD65A69
MAGKIEAIARGRDGGAVDRRLWGVEAVRAIGYLLNRSFTVLLGVKIPLYVKW